MLNGKNNSDGYLAYKSIREQKLRPRTNEFKMFGTIEEFFEYYFKTNKYLNKENILQISFYKLIYRYLIESNRLLAVDLFEIGLRCTQDHLNFRNKLYPKRKYDIKSLAGRCVRLYTVLSLFLTGIKGQFKSILP
ncbi:unnamed protein product [Rotaria socialis]|uniref:Uncharacterized protein n=1 Tax=Rotaria socialis TaxID=392032 RepID=A0A818QBB9_9BILA|nr:unnamed protein product [Rotaria socialis]CAF3434623.1 unnamed protein product [Rotaria socialis]CAF3440015.1 unnamed protein product [Rotaria socialis]CAF3502624.1 unnamed protein product [Rotaria socialis]CAF3638513.1 unnamed protein product [Rotaria socialis]